MSYTPSMKRVRDLYSWALRWDAGDHEDRPDLAKLQKEQRAEFDRALAEHDAITNEEYYKEGYIAGLREAFSVASIEVLHENARGNLKYNDYWIGAAAIMNRLNKLISQAKGDPWASTTPDPLED